MAKLTTRTLASGVTVDDLLHIVITGDTSQDPAGSSYKASIKQIFDAITGYCISDLYVSNIHSCSPLRINPLDEGNVYFGSTSGVTIDVINSSFGIGTGTPTEKLHISGGDMLVENTNGKFITDIQNTAGAPLVLLSGGTNGITRYGVIVPTFDAITMGIRGGSDLTYPGYGKQGDAFIYSSNNNNGFNVISRQGTGTDDYIRFYAGIDATSTPDIHIQGSGSTRGYVGIGTNSPSEILHVEGNTKINGTLNISTLGTGTTISNLGIDSNGFVVTGTTGSVSDIFVSGGTYSAGTATFTNTSGGTFDVTGFTSFDTYVIAGTYIDSTDTISLLRNDGNFVYITGITDTFTTGATLNGTVLEFDRNDLSNAYNVDLNPLIFTGNTSGDCINDIFVKNIHSCLPLNINPLDEGNVYFGSTSGVTIDINSGGNIMNLGDVNVQSDNSINPNLIVAGFNAINRKGFIVNFDNPDTNTIQVANNNTSGNTVIMASSILQSNKTITLEYGGDDYIRPGIAPVNGFDFYKNKGILSIGTKSDGMVINISQTGNTGNLWFEQNGNSIMYLKGGPSPSDGSLGLMLNPDGTEEPTANLQVGGTGTTGTFKYVDGNELSGWVLTSDNDGNATWQAPSVFTGGTVNGPTNFTNGLTANTISATTYYNLPGSSSGNCFVDFYVRNVHGCSPISIWDETQTNGSNAYGTLSFSLGNSTKTYGNYSHANGELSETGSNNGYLLTGCTAGVCTLDSSYNDVSLNFTTGTTSFVFFDDTSYSSLYSSSVFSVSAVTFNGTNTVVYLYDTSVETLGNNAIMSDTNPPILWGGDQVFGGHNANATGQRTQAIGNGSTSKGSGSYSIGLGSSSEGQSYTYGIYGHAEGFSTTSYGDYSHSEGSGSNAIGIGSHAEGTNTQAIGSSSHAEGTNSVASGQYSHSEGSSTASGIFSHAQGDSSVASGQYAHSQNKGTQAIGGSTHAGGFGGIARGEVSFSHGFLTEANGSFTAVLGGDLNIISSGGTYGSAILGGSGNTITYLSLTDDVSSSAIIGGSGNTVTSFESAIIGGEFNNVTAPRSVILGGANITANASDTTYVPNFVISTSYTPTSSADTVGEPGSITWDNNYLYYKDNSGWKRLSGSTF